MRGGIRSQQYVLGVATFNMAYYIVLCLFVIVLVIHSH